METQTDENVQKDPKLYNGDFIEKLKIDGGVDEDETPETLEWHLI